jgi:hypothetical protein
MLFNYKNLDRFDSCEDCLTAKVLLGLIFNPFVSANSNNEYKLSKKFLKYYLGDIADDLNYSEAEILFKPKYSWFNTERKEVKDHTAPDLLMLFPPKVIVAFEIKYTLPVQHGGNKKLEPQFKREYEGLKSLQNKFAVNESYVFLLMTHERLFRHIKGIPDNGLKILRKCYKEFGDNFRTNTWNCVYQALSDIDAKYLPEKNKILNFLERKENYMTNPLDGTKKRNEVKLISFENNKLPVYNWKELKKLINDESKVLAQESGTVEDYKKVEEIYENGKNNGNWCVGRKGGEKTIIEDGRTNWKRHNGKYCMNSKKPPRGRNGNWITSKRFAELLDKYGFPLSRE